MDSIDDYRAIVRRIIQGVADFAPPEDGVRKEVVLGFHPPSHRKYTEFAGE